TPGNLVTLTLLVGVVMTLLGVFRLGAIMDFVSNAVMTGFTTGIALQIVAGVIGDATGYETTRHNTVAKLADGIVHLPDWDGATVAITLATIGVWVACRFVRQVRSLGTLVALAAGTLLVSVFDVHVPLVGGIAQIPSALPAVHAPSVSAMPDLVPGAVAVAM